MALPLSDCSKSPAEFEKVFQELYKSLLSNQAKVAENLSLKEKHCVPNTAWRNCIALHNLRQSTKVPLDDVHRRERSMESEVLMEKNSSNNVPIAGIYSAADETAKLCAKATNVNCDIFLGKANTENNFSIRKQMIQTQGLSPIIVNEGKTSEAVHDDDESISVNSGEDDRETVTCDECTEMFWKVINKKEPRKRRRELDKKSPYDPASLACDQWILKKPLVRDNLHKYRREIESSIKYLKSLAGFAQAKDTVKWIPQCSRPHVFLHRNLRSCKRKVDEYLHENRKKKPQKKERKRSRKKDLFVYELPEVPFVNILSDNEDSEFEMEITTVKRKLASAVLNREAKPKKDCYDFSDNSNTYESEFGTFDSKSMQCENSTCLRQEKHPLDLFLPDITSASSTSITPYPINQLHSQHEDRKLWRKKANKNSTDSLSSSFGWLKPGGFKSMIAKLRAGHQTLPGSVVKET
ncbi:uncharacterized protein [Narcine bancroftii]|uniref:uncharacterized protein isoform X2 n=1 Tax=Narcine bancroftii TaxID=1343680 RepID=UPI0038318D4B